MSEPLRRNGIVSTSASGLISVKWRRVVFHVEVTVHCVNIELVSFSLEQVDVSRCLAFGIDVNSQKQKAVIVRIGDTFWA